jgi:cobalamin biosynthesis protein CobD/CbiB
VYYALYAANPLLAILWNVLVLYLTMGFRHFSSAFSEISLALTEGRDLDARMALSRWTGHPAAELSVGEISRLAIEQGVVDSYRHVFGTMFWFVLLPGRPVPCCTVCAACWDRNGVAVRVRKTVLVALPAVPPPGWTGCRCV